MTPTLGMPSSIPIPHLLFIVASALFYVRSAPSFPSIIQLNRRYDRETSQPQERSNFVQTYRLLSLIRFASISTIPYPSSLLSIGDGDRTCRLSSLVVCAGPVIRLLAWITVRHGSWHFYSPFLNAAFSTITGAQRRFRDTKPSLQ